MKKYQMLEIVAEKIKTCTLCNELVTIRINTVPGHGNPNSKILLVGEAAGQKENETGLPFVGKAGELLTNILSNFGIKREDVFILNVLKCRPPNNRTPDLKEINNCKPFLRLQIDIIKPKVIMCLGRIAAKTILDMDFSISKLRGRIFHHNNEKVVVTYHPSFLLRCENRNLYEELVCEDFNLLLKTLNM